MEMFDNDNAVFDLSKENLVNLFNNIQGSYSDFNRSKIHSAKLRMEQAWYDFMSLAVDTLYKNAGCSPLYTQETVK